jgi:hypothetical protein
VGPTTPRRQRLPALTPPRFSLIRFRSPLLTESQLFSLPTGTEMFHFPAFPPHTLYIQVRVTPHDWGRVSPFGHPRITARLTAPRGLSQPPTSFIGSWCQGIHRAPLITWPQRCSHPLCSSQRTTGHHHTHTTHHPQPTARRGSLAPRRHRIIHTPETTPHTTVRVFPQDPTACRQPHQRPHTRSTPPPTAGAVLNMQAHPAQIASASIPRFLEQPPTTRTAVQAALPPPHQQGQWSDAP